MYLSFSEASDSNARRIETKSCFHVVNPCVMVVVARGGGALIMLRVERSPGSCMTLRSGGR